MQISGRVKPPACPTVVKQKLVMPQDRKQILKHVQKMFFSFFSKQAGILQVYYKTCSSFSGSFVSSPWDLLSQPAVSITPQSSSYKHMLWWVNWVKAGIKRDPCRNHCWDFPSWRRVCLHLPGRTRSQKKTWMKPTVRVGLFFLSDVWCCFLVVVFCVF